MKLLTARYVLPISSEPVANAGVVIDGTTIADVGPQDDLVRRYPEAQRLDIGYSAILPGLVNCHSHLEITAMRGALDSVEHDFLKWLLRLNKLREKLSEEEITSAAIAGAVEGARAGVTCFGDVGRRGRAGLEALKTVGLRGVLFQETEFSPDDSTAGQDFDKLLEKFNKLSADSTELVEIGLSPHSPYTVSRALFERIAQFAVAYGIKLAVHAAESAEEDDLLRNGNGFFTEFYGKFGFDWQPPGTSAIKYLSETGILESRPLLIHCVKVTEDEIDLIDQSGSRIAHCPKSNAKFGHGRAPLARFMETGLAVGLGSDSVASNNLCDMLEEARFAALASRNSGGLKPFIADREMLEIATLGGAKALGLADKIGKLERGMQADIAVISLENIAQQPVSDIHSALVFASNARDVVMTIVAGKVIYDGRSVITVDEKELKSQLRDIGLRLAT